MELRTGALETAQIRLRFWTAFAEYMLRASELRTWKPTIKSYIDYRLSPCSGLISIASTSGTVNKDPELRAEFWIDGGDFEARYAMIMANRAEIESEVGQSLVWDNLSGYKTSSRKSCIRKPADFRDQTKWPEQHKWLRENLEKLSRVLSPWVEKSKRSTVNSGD
jgi:hypothetical protein